ILLRTALSSSDSFFLISASVSAFGTMSNNNTSTPMFAKWHAIPEPIIPDPITATFLMILFMLSLVEYIFILYECMDDLGNFHKSLKLFRCYILFYCVIEFKDILSREFPLFATKIG